ncbi:uncharacterized protein LOC106404347 [Brassica napus]|uniref:uncharacterized protein LOC106404347 n=1 Tax=Brassica napus TaxID=3708 RepID=UPI0006AB0F5E|nr:uncharacterized protein LOC106404347 [Brassica napus]
MSISAVVDVKPFKTMWKIKGGKIHVLVKRELVAQFSSFLGQGGSLMLINFSVTHSCGTYRTTNHPYRIGFLSTTRVRSCEKFPEDLAGFEPVKYTELFDGSLNPDYLILSVRLFEISDIEHVNVNGKETEKISLEL